MLFSFVIRRIFLVFFFILLSIQPFPVSSSFGDSEDKLAAVGDDELGDLINRAHSAAGLGDLDKAEELYEQAKVLAKKQNNGKILLGKIYSNLGALAQVRGDVKVAQQYFLKALPIFEELGKPTLELGVLLTNIGTIYQVGQDHDMALKHFEKSLTILRKAAPSSNEIIITLTNAAQVALGKNDTDAAEAYWLEVLPQYEKHYPGTEAHSSVLTALGKIARDKKEYKRAIDYLENSLKIEKTLEKNSPYIIEIQRILGEVYYEHGDLYNAEKLFQTALESKLSNGPDDLETARFLNNLGMINRDRGALEKAERFSLKALKIQEELVPNSSEVSKSLSNLGRISHIRGDLKQAEKYLQKSHDIRKILAPNSRLLVDSLTDLGNVLYARGLLKQSEKYYVDALELQKKLDSEETAGLAICYNNLGGIALQRGDFAQSEKNYLKARKIIENLSPRSPTEALCLNNLGIIAAIRLDFDLATRYWEQAIEIWNRVTPESIDLARTFTNLGDLHRAQGNYEKSESLHQQALVLLQKNAPEAEAVIHSLHNLADVYSELGNNEKAKAYYCKALEASEKMVRGGINSAYSLYDLGRLARENKNYEEAYDYLKKSLEIREKLAPASIHVVECLHELGLLFRDQGKHIEALDFFRQTVDLFENQKIKLGGTREVWQEFRANYRRYYYDFIDLQIKNSFTSEAFHTLERSRARTLLEILAERDLDLSRDVPPEILEAGADIDKDYENIQQKMLQCDPLQDAAQLNTYLDALRRLNKTRDQHQELLKSSAPRYAALKYPEPLDLSALHDHHVLDPETILLAYSVSEQKVFLFVIEADRKRKLDIFTLPVNEETLEKHIRLLYRLIQTRQPVEVFTELCTTLYSVLVKPAEERIARNKRVVIIPDGPLHNLPFSVLIRDTGEISAETPVTEYLAQWKPIQTVVSATVYEQLKGNGNDIDNDTVIAFGNPAYQRDIKASKPESDTYLRAAILRGLKLSPLPGTKDEVEVIGGLYKEKATLLVGENATEEQAKELSSTVSIIHFACHGFVDNLFPLDSALALTIPEEFGSDHENGLFQAWEIMQDVRLNADLVTLSACATAQGKLMSGEGIIGLTRAFQYAGAKSVLASLWSVSDLSTKEFMTLFYRNLIKGKNKGEALQAAQKVMINDESTDMSHPFHWAAFTLIGR